MTEIDFSKISVLTFDCYGTLIDWEAGILSVLRPWADRQKLDITDEGLLAAFAVQEPLIQAEQPKLAYPDVLRLTMKHIGVALEANAGDEDAEALGRSVPNWPAFPDTTNALNRLRQKFKLVILSNIDGGSFAESNKRLGVSFDAIFTAEDVGSYKPDHGHFKAAFNWLDEQGIPRDQLVHVAQSLFHDHVPAKTLGIPSVWIDRRHGRSEGGATKTPTVPVKPDLTYKSMGEFADHACREGS